MEDKKEIGQDGNESRKEHLRLKQRKLQNIDKN